MPSRPIAVGGVMCLTGGEFDRTTESSNSSELFALEQAAAALGWKGNPEKTARVFPSQSQSDAAVPPEAAGRIRLIALVRWSIYEIRRLRAELALVSNRLGRRKLVDRAKAALQAKHGLSEQEAYEQLRKLSRRRRMPMEDVAEMVLRSGSGLQAD